MNASFFTRIGTLFGDIGRANDAVRIYERLDAMSDRQLAARGLRRGDIVAAARKASTPKT